MPSWRDYKGQSLGLARVMSEVPYSDGKTAQLIKNWVVDEKGYLDSTYRIMAFIPYEWNGGLPPAAFEEITLGNTNRSGVLAMEYTEIDGERPEILILTNSGVFRYAPWTRPTSIPTTNSNNYGLEEQTYYDSSNTSYTLSPQSSPRYPPQMEKYGNRIYFTFCDGGGLWVWDGYKIRPFGYTQRPSPPSASGPQRTGNTLTDSNLGGFSHRGRIGTTDTAFGTHFATDGDVAGGIDTSIYRYAVVYENTDGAYSARSVDGPKVSIEFELAGADEPVERLLKKFRLHDIPRGPSGTVARILLRTRNLQRLPTGDFGDYHFLHRIPNNEAQEYIDDIPDGELGAVWSDRASTPIGTYLAKSFSGSLWLMRNDAYPYRVWWSEQEQAGPIPESFMDSHWLDVFPSTGPITAAVIANISDAQKPFLLVFKEDATHYITGEYPNWQVGTLHSRAGCAGPELVQTLPDGSIVWYGGGTFWKMVNSGEITDMGSGIRKRLQGANTRRVKLGVSWVDRQYREGIFVLPMDDSLQPNVQFVWDYQNQGWRIREDLRIDCALTLPEVDCTLLGGVTQYETAFGSVSANTDSGTVFVYHRSYPQFPVPTRQSDFITGWQSFSGLGPKLHSAHRATQIIITAQERSENDATVSAYEDWNLDDIVGSSIPISSAHPEDTSIPFFGTATYNSTFNYRAERVYGEKVGIDIASQAVHSIKVSTTNPLALYNIDIWGPFMAGAGSRTPTNDP